MKSPQVLITLAKRNKLNLLKNKNGSQLFSHYSSLLCRLAMSCESMRFPKLIRQLLLIFASFLCLPFVYSFFSLLQKVHLIHVYRRINPLLFFHSVCGIWGCLNKFKKTISACVYASVWLKPVRYYCMKNPCSNSLSGYGARVRTFTDEWYRTEST